IGLIFCSAGGRSPRGFRAVNPNRGRIAGQRASAPHLAVRTRAAVAIHAPSHSCSVKGRGLMKLKMHVYAFIASMLAFVGMATLASAAQSPTQNPVRVGKNGFMVGASYQNDVSLPLYYLPAYKGAANDEEERREAALNPLTPS